MKKQFLSLLISTLVTLPAWALTGSKVGLEGYVTAFDKEKITVESGTQKVEVPRKFYAHKVKTGEKIIVQMEQKEFDALKRTEIQPAKK